jgi:hypothetical protein
MEVGFAQHTQHNPFKTSSADLVVRHLVLVQYYSLFVKYLSSKLALVSAPSVSWWGPIIYLFVPLIQSKLIKGTVPKDESLVLKCR